MILPKRAIAALLCSVIGLLLGLQKFNHDQRMAILLRDYNHPSGCKRLGEGILDGPEDMALDTINNIIFVSSHNRRDIASTGKLYAIDLATDNVVPMTVEYPPNFRPHGMAIAQGCGTGSRAGGRTTAFSSQVGEVSDSETAGDNVVTSQTRLFVISHVDLKQFSHTIEVFHFEPHPKRRGADAASSHASLLHVETIRSAHFLNSPNDLIALSCNEVVVSNDLSRGTFLEILSHLLLKTRKATMVYYNMLESSSWSFLSELQVHTETLDKPYPPTPPHRAVDPSVQPKTTKTSYVKRKMCASFGNGLIALPGGVEGSSTPSLLLRSSSNDNILLTYEMSHTKDDGVMLANEHEVLLPISPDNIELSPLDTMEVLITGHPFIPYFILHALPLPAFLRPHAPSAVLQYNAIGRNFSVLYYDTGEEFSASSVAVIASNMLDSGGHKQQKKLYMGQVFDSFVLSCPLT